MLGGDGTVAGNVVTLYHKTTNNKLMKKIEYEVRNLAEEGKIVDYLVEPKYHTGAEIPHEIKIDVRVNNRSITGCPVTIPNVP